MLTIDLPLPPSANHLFANAHGGGRVKTKAYKSWIEEARYHVITAWRAAGKPEVGRETPMSLTMRLGLVERRRDASNCTKAIEDVLVRELPIPDDRYNDRILIERDETLAGIARVTIAPLHPT
jgi:Holliday junction resolvase RusA-like endonuclease